MDRVGYLQRIFIKNMGILVEETGIIIEYHIILSRPLANKRYPSFRPPVILSAVEYHSTDHGWTMVNECVRNSMHRGK
ncbi:hypothetical protein BOTCAL_0001g00630 [Botryotinia calthae]|uniref:Uncharacterized protein n=1 Tax=Botryotinia calthae TaxID=38488 RepID=A0A4Y8DKG0_9HELO|nr:hypothetical protein BOTCAL_0001g00630 [Botryotinia calthae]